MAVKVEDISVPVTRHTARVNGRSLRVIQAHLQGRLAEGRVCGSSHQAVLDKRSIQRLAVLWSLAARSRYTVVWARISPLPWPIDDHVVMKSDSPTMDLVLLQHSFQVRPSWWPRIRGRLSPGRVGTVSQPRRAFGPEELRYRPDWEAARDPVSVVVAAHTVMITSSQRGFGADLPFLRDHVEESPAEHAEHPDWQMCLSLARGYLHVDYASRLKPAGKAPEPEP